MTGSVSLLIGLLMPALRHFGIEWATDDIGWGFTILGAVLLAIGLLFWTPYILYKEHVELAARKESDLSRELDELKESARPKLRVFLGKNVIGCIQTEIAPPTTIYVRARVETDNANVVHHCRGYLTFVSRDDSVLLAGNNIPLSFAQAHLSDAKDKTVSKGKAEFLDLFSIQRVGRHIHPPPEHDTHHVQLAIHDKKDLPATHNFYGMFLLPGTYRLKIAIESEAPILAAEITFKFEQGFDEAELSIETRETHLIHV